LANLEAALKSVALPAPAFTQESWYGLAGGQPGANGDGDSAGDSDDGDVVDPVRPDEPPTADPSEPEQDGGAAVGG
jgi:hypothetical protein